VHTPAQVIVGALVGCGFGIVWYLIGTSWVRPHYGWIEDTRLAQLLAVKDSSSIDDVLYFEWRASRLHRGKQVPAAGGLQPLSLRKLLSPALAR